MFGLTKKPTPKLTTYVHGGVGIAVGIAALLAMSQHPATTPALRLVNPQTPDTDTLPLESSSVPSEFDELAARCAPNVSKEILGKLVMAESRFNPYAIGINADGAQLARQPTSQAEAAATAQWLLQNGYNIDAGLGQINSGNFKRLGLGVNDAFDMCKNLAAAATVLHENYMAALPKYNNDEQEAVRAALSAYNTGSFRRGIENGYVDKVIQSNATPAPVVPNVEVPPIALVKSAKARPQQRQAESETDIYMKATGSLFVDNDKQ
jgi:type IV secretion system protein VirB1